MINILLKSFGGLTAQYLFRQYVFGIVMAILLFIVIPKMNFGIGVFIVINTLLYPYARFVYETIIDFIIGDHFFILPIPVLFMWKTFTMIMVWGFAIFIAPVGLLCLYLYHTYQEKKALSATDEVQ